MRPVDRGDNARVFSDYTEAKGDLLDRLGKYCSYCERPGDLAVEHIEPKSLYPERLLDWLNYLLACNNCNGIKTDKDTLASRHLLPDRDNTAHSFLYSLEGRISINPALSSDDFVAAQRTLELVGLQRTPPPDPRRRDERWSRRRTIWQLAEEAQQDLAQNDTQEMRNLIVKLAIGYGFFSVWMTIFMADADMKHRFLDAFPGTRRSCFDSQGNCHPALAF